MDALGDLINPYQPTIKQMVDEYCSFAAIKQELAELYMKEFTLNDMNGFIRFYSSPLGRKLVKKQLILMEKVDDLAVKKLNEHLPKFQALIGKEIKDDE